tara:strand:+ start:18371 stop:18841 length:471 start_codon:yes stop_codon:yes gene_type:complete
MAKKTTKKKVEVNNVVPKDMQEIMDDSVNREVCNAPTIMVGMNLRPVTLASIALLKETGSSLVNGEVLDGNDNIVLDCCMFILIQSGTIEDASRLVFGADSLELKMASMALAEKVNPAEVADLTTNIIGMLNDSMSTQVKPIPDKEEGELIESGND